MTLYVIGEAYSSYFVLGGNHRLSVARCQDAESKEKGGDAVDRVRARRVGVLQWAVNSHGAGFSQR